MYNWHGRTEPVKLLLCPLPPAVRILSPRALPETVTSCQHDRDESERDNFDNDNHFDSFDNFDINKRVIHINQIRENTQVRLAAVDVASIMTSLGVAGIIVGIACERGG